MQAAETGNGRKYECWPREWGRTRPDVLERKREREGRDREGGRCNTERASDTDEKR